MAQDVPVVGITGPAAPARAPSPMSWCWRFIRDFPDKSVAILAVDPSRATDRRGPAGRPDPDERRSIPTGSTCVRWPPAQSQTELSAAIQDAIDVVRAAGFDLVLVETSGIGQGNAGVVGVCDVSLYVMTCEFGAPIQLEKIEMLDFADLVAINKFEHKGAEDALRSVRKQYRSQPQSFRAFADEELPVFGTIASQFNDPGTNVLYLALLKAINCEEGHGLAFFAAVAERESLKNTSYRPIAFTTWAKSSIRTGLPQTGREQAAIARRLFQTRGAKEVLREGPPSKNWTEQIAVFEGKLAEEPKKLLQEWPERKASYRRDQLVTKVRDKEIRSDLYTTTLSGTRIPKVCLPDFADWGEIVRWSMFENAPGCFPFTAGVFPFKRARRGPQTPVRRRGDAGADEPALSLSLQERRRQAAFHGL